MLLTGITAAIAVQQPALGVTLPAAYKAAAHGDIVALDATPVPAGSLASVRLGHSSGSVDSTTAAPNSRAESANLDGSALLDNVPLDVDSVTATAPPRSGPTSRSLLPIPPNPLLKPGLIEGSVPADYASATACPVAVAGQRVYSDSLTSLAQTTVGDLSAVPGAPSSIASVGASRVRTVTALVDDAVGGSDVEAVTTTTVGDVSLFGGRAVVRVTSPVVLRAHSDGTTGTAAFDSPPTVRVLLASAPAIPVPLNGSPVTVPIAIPGLNTSVTVTGFGLTNASTGATAAASLQALLRVDVDLTLATTQVADVSLSPAPMDVRAEAPVGGVTCNRATPTPSPTATTPATDNPDRDGDGLTNVRETKLGTDPR
ncbi:hypothetical protein [Nocardioides sp. B-3]|uniref:hypothetical protein n=1 Tax=Nocardioides sp. B-3 TaxID=2895565 RepID=UPI002152E968|nr:hypothetical protein [Nocardioides sp. B-3]UUZ58858.1 hypothetical protein LP418_22740 [Nocardioides sp. B-3]